jgi:hypothetical protein
LMQRGGDGALLPLHSGGGVAVLFFYISGSACCFLPLPHSDSKARPWAVGNLAVPMGDRKIALP